MVGFGKSDDRYPGRGRYIVPPDIYGGGRKVGELGSRKKTYLDTVSHPFKLEEEKSTPELGKSPEKLSKISAKSETKPGDLKKWIPMWKRKQLRESEESES